jgi:tetratricopeptide (TPR) repeat protein
LPLAKTVDATVKKKIGKYEITGILGRGGMGVVYRAEDKRIGRQVAIKTLTEGTGEPGMLDRFYREAQTGFLQHPNIVIVYDLGDEDGVPFIVMEYVNGMGLDKVISSGKQLPLIEKLTIIEQVCNALGYAHHQGVVHRDIKPANVMVQQDGNAKLVDFGIARVQKSGVESGLTRTGNVIGTIHYIAPERLKGQPFDGRSDIFATGVMLYLLLTGQLPFSGEDMTVLQKLVNEPHPPLKTFLTNYPPALDGIIDRSLAKDPSQRYATAEEFAADLHGLAEELKKGQISELFNDAERLAAEEQFGRAREVLLQLVRIDPQHTSARSLLGVVQQNLARLQRVEQVRQLIAEAEQAIHSERFTEAMGSLDQALKLDPDNEELKARIEDARTRKQRFDEVNGLLTQADSMREHGDISGAMSVVEKALRLDQNSTRVRALYAEVSRQAKIAAQQGQIREMMGKARQEVSSRRFTEAIEILREVGKIDPSLPEMEVLLQTAVAAQEQERRRKLLEQINTEIENLLAAEEYERATELVERAVAQLPTESSLLQLKTRVDLLTRKFRVKQLVDSTAAKAQEVFAQSPGEALLIVQRALQELPGEERLLALEDSLRQRLKAAEKEEVRGRYLREAQAAIDRSQFEKAVEVLESYQLEFTDASGVGQLLEFARGELAQQKKRERVAASISQARTLLQEERFGQAIDLLKAASAESADPALARALTEAREQQQEFEQKAEALISRILRLREHGQLDEALAMLQKQPSTAVAGTKFNALQNEIRNEQAKKNAMSTAFAGAAQSVQNGKFQDAIDSLQTVQRAYGESEELTRAIAEIEARRVQVANETVAKSVEAARAAMLANNVQGAQQELRNAAEWVEFASPTGQTDWRRLSAEAGKPVARRTTGTIPQVGYEVEAEEAPKKKLLIPILGGGLLVAAIVGVALWHPWSPTAPATPAGPNAGQSPAVKLPPAPVSGTLVLEGNVAGAEILIDGHSKDFTQSGPQRLSLDPGTHTLQFTKPGYTDSKPETITITANNETAKRFDLTPIKGAVIPAETMGYLSIHTTATAQVKIDGAAQGNADARGEIMVKVNPGARALTIDLNGYQPYSQNFNIKAGDRNNVYAQLAVIQPTAPKVQPVQVTSFSASPNAIDQGQSTTLQWQTANAVEVSIDDGEKISKVSTNGNATLSPSSDTAYLLTAKSSDGNTQQRTVRVSVKQKQVVASNPQPVQPSTPTAVDETPAIKSALNAFTSALGSHNVDGMHAAWGSMPAGQEKSYRELFKNAPKVSMTDECPASGLSVSGDSATWSCTETVQNPGQRTQTVRYRFTFSKRGGSWTISNRGQG